MSILEELGKNGWHHQILREKLPYIDLFSSLYDRKCPKTFSVDVRKLSYMSTSYVVVSLLVRWSMDDGGPFGLEKRFFMIFGRINLRVSLSGAKFDAETDFDVSSVVASPNLTKLMNEKLIFRSEKFANLFFSR